MSGRYFIIILFLLCVGFCVGNTSSQLFPLCNQPLNEIVRVNRGEDATLLVSLRIQSYHYHWNAEFAWINGEGIEICRSSRGGSCVSGINSKFRMAVNGRSDGSEIYINFELTIVKSSYSDNGIYFVKSSYREVCTILRVNVIVRVTFPLCTALLVNENENLKLSCKWMLREYSDQMELFAGNQTLQLLENNALISGTEMCGNTATVISSTFSIRDVFDNNRIPDTCLVSNYRLDFEKRFEFSVSMSPNVNEINEYERDVSFICCSDNANVPTMWWYNKCTKLTPLITGQPVIVTLDEHVCGQGCEETQKSVMFMCGKEKYGRTILFGIGKLILSLGHHRVALSTELKSGSGVYDVSNSGQNCENTWIIIVTAHWLDFEHVMGGSTSGTETVAYSTPISSTSLRYTSYIMYHTRAFPSTTKDQTEISKHFNVTPSTLSPLNMLNYEGFDIFWDLSTQISAALILVISLLFNIVLGFERFYRKILKSRNDSTIERNRMRNIPQVFLNTRNMSEINETLEMDTLSTEFVQVHLPDSVHQAYMNTGHQHDQQANAVLRGAGREYRPPKRSDQDLTMSSPGVSENTIPPFKRNVVVEETKKTFTIKHEEINAFNFKGEFSPAIYQNYSESNGALTIPENDSGNAPIKHLSQQAHEEYMNCPTDEHNHPDCLYAMPDELRRSRNISTDDFQCPAPPNPRNKDTLTSTAPDYAILDRSEEFSNQGSDKHDVINSGSIDSCRFDEYEEIATRAAVPKVDPTPGSRSPRGTFDDRSSTSTPVTLLPFVTNTSTSDYDSFQRPDIEAHLLHQRFN